MVCPTVQVALFHFDRSYGSARQEPPHDARDVPQACISELFLFAVLSPLLVADLERDFCTTLVTSDASPSYGFGVSVRETDPAVIKHLATLSEDHGDYLRLTLEEGDEREKERRGTPVRLPFAQADFVDILNIKAKHISHAGAMEAEAVLLAIKWVIRSSSRFATRLVLGVDAKAVLHAIMKGRSSAPSLTRIIKAIAAHCLAANLLVHPIYIPSESNPADGPSRGVRKRPPGRRLLKPLGFSYVERAEERRVRSLAFFRAFGEESYSDASSALESGW